MRAARPPSIVPTIPQHGVVALKVLREKLRQDRTAVARFTREAKFGTRVQHPNVVRTIETGESGRDSTISPSSGRPARSSSGTRSATHRCLARKLRGSYSDRRRGAGRARRRDRSSRSEAGQRDVRSRVSIRSSCSTSVSRPRPIPRPTNASRAPGSSSERSCTSRPKH